MKLIIDFQYFSNINYYKLLLGSSYTLFDQYESFRRMGFHNRFIIAGAQGRLTLSVPIEGGRNQKGLFKDTRISYRDKWQQDHWKGIVSCYSRSPWFEFYRDELSVIYHHPHIFLLDRNRACFEWVMRCLRSTIPWSVSTEYKEQYTEEDRLDLRGAITPKNPGLVGRDYQLAAPIVYRQVFEDRNGFIPDLSILDLLFCEGGKRAVSLLKD